MSGTLLSLANSRMARTVAAALHRRHEHERRAATPRLGEEHAEVGLEGRGGLRVALRPLGFRIVVRELHQEKSPAFIWLSTLSMRWPAMKLFVVSPPSALLQTAISGLRNWQSCVGQLPPGPRRGSPTVESPAMNTVGTLSSFTISSATT